MSFTNWDGCSAGYDWIKFDSYIAILKNKDLWMSPRNNVVYFVGHLLLVPVELALAMLLTSKLRMAKFYRTMVFMPYIINDAAVVYAFSYFFSPMNGASDAILSPFHLDGLIRGWLSDIKAINYVLANVSLWRFSGYHVVLFMAALQSLLQDVQGAARVDGVNAWQPFRYIQIPSTMLTVDSVLLDSIRGTFQVFGTPYVMTSGEPGYASPVPMLHVIDTAFKYNSFGLTSTIAVAIMLIIVVTYLIQNRIMHGIVLRGVEK